MKVLIASAEVAPFAKAGGLADVIGSLPKELKRLGVDAKVIMPLYGNIEKAGYELEPVLFSELEILLDGELKKVSLKKGCIPDDSVEVYFVENEEYFGRHVQTYPQNQHYRFEQERYILFCKAVLELIKRIDYQPDIIHCNDWHTAFIPVFLKNIYNGDFYQDIKTLFSIHNLAYQGWYSPDILKLAGLPASLFTMDKLEFYGDVNWMKGGIYFADAINTVSEKYAEEIKTKEYGERLEGFLAVHKYKLSGIVNGIDYSVWNPKTDKHIAKNFSLRGYKGKTKCKEYLQEVFDLESKTNVPVVSLVSRLVNQKGLDLIEQLGDELGEMNAQFVFLGTGDEKHEKLLRKLSDNYSNISTDIRFCSNLSHNVYAGSDFFLMPSKFEPCGLGQLIAMKYGTLPIVRATGGLADTVIDGETGFSFIDYDAREFLEVIKRAIHLYHQQPKDFERMQKNAMKADFGWEQSAKKYIELYSKL